MIDQRKDDYEVLNYLVDPQESCVVLVANVVVAEYGPSWVYVHSPDSMIFKRSI